MILDIFGRGNEGVVTVKQPAEIGDDEPNPPGSYHSSILSSKRFRISRQLLLCVSRTLHVFNHFFVISHNSVFPVENG